MTYLCSQPYIGREDQEGVVLLWDNPDYGPIRFYATPTDRVAHGVEIYDLAMAGEFGPVTSYADSHWYSTVKGNVWQGNTYGAGNLMISPTGEQPPNSTQTPPPQS